MDSIDFAEKIKEEVKSTLANGTKGSFLHNILDSNNIEAAYNKTLNDEESSLSELEEKIKKGKLAAEKSVVATLNSDISKSASTRYADRLTLFKIGYDSKLAMAQYIAFATGKAQAIDNPEE